MQRFLAIKFVMIVGLCLLFLVGLAMISGLVEERANYERQVIDEIAQTQIGTQTIATPFVVVQKDGKFVPILPTASDIQGKLDVSNDQYARGIYRATSYQSTLGFRQAYNSDFVSQTQASLIMPISDLRGVSLPTVNINGKAYTAQFADLTLSGLGEHTNYLMVKFELPAFANLPDGTVNPVRSLDIGFEMNLAGLSAINVIPLGDDNRLSLSGNWQEPKFHGNALPNQKTLNATGFLATWQTPFLSQQNNGVLKQNFKECQQCGLDNFNQIRTDFVVMDNAYTKTDRTIKYALILLLVSFGTFFLFEIIKGLKIHPIQYLLVASGLLMFYGLLLSLAELLVFYQAYAIACVACVGLIAWYSYFLLKSVIRSLIFGGILGGLYAGFYVILSANEMNLLLGSLFCFGLLFVVMFITRKIDWYRIGDNKFANSPDNLPSADLITQGE